jgi:DegV family protein with EDD domain
MIIKFVTDSTSDIPAEMARQLGITVIPALLNIGQASLLDGVDISRSDFYSLLPEMVPPPTTSSPSVGQFQARYEQLLSQGADHIISIHPPNHLSGIFNAARLAAEHFKGRVQVEDSGQVSLGLGFQVLLAAEASRAGASLENVSALLAGIRKRVRLAALLDSIKYLRRSGRVSWAAATIGGLLHLKPIVELRHGIVHRLGQARTRLQGVERLLESLNSWGPIERLAVLHTNTEERARDLLNLASSKMVISPLIVNVTTVIGVHVGPDGLGLVAVPAAG